MARTAEERVTPLRASRPCPECGKPSLRVYYPFCSKRCKDVDLNRWLSGNYVIPSRDNEDEENN
ncbi:DNA gyrase inhibitor YacG [Chelativorans sp. YIM 93263]|uniref:DNA gyrase inhibitor YacG n=1 Tax=Chelativorans sp. YIM 93263 TaxID=2906648 RepID=UPI0023784CB4|nr:DNA gyrase inhibitor YacG [Chelativorans sp. YIM 93263]